MTVSTSPPLKIALRRSDARQHVSTAQTARRRSDSAQMTVSMYRPQTALWDALNAQQTDARQHSTDSAQSARQQTDVDQHTPTLSTDALDRRDRHGGQCVWNGDMIALMTPGAVPGNLGQ